MEEPTGGEFHSFEEKLRRVIEWAPEGSGPHNFLRIITDKLEDSIANFLVEKGYTIVHFNDLNKEGERDKLERLLINAQSYMYRQLPEKIAMIVTKQAKQQVVEEQTTQDEWRLHSQYMISMGDT